MFGPSRFGHSTFSLSRFGLSRFGHSRFGPGFNVSDGWKPDLAELWKEACGILPIPEKLRNFNICIHTDNMSCVFGMKDG
jgi:hypothetical protein